MKLAILLISIFTTSIFFNPANAQAKGRVNICDQPLWGPVGYNYVEYYYLPAYEIYYNVPTNRFVYYDAGGWRFVTKLPENFGTKDYYSTCKVVMNHLNAYMRFKDHKAMFAGYKGEGNKPVVIRDSHESKYYVVKDHPNYSNGINAAVTHSRVKHLKGNSKSASLQSNAQLPSSNIKFTPTLNESNEVVACEVEMTQEKDAQNIDPNSKMVWCE